MTPKKQYNYVISVCFEPLAGGRKTMKVLSKGLSNNWLQIKLVYFYLQICKIFYEKVCIGIRIGIWIRIQIRLKTIADPNQSVLNCLFKKIFTILFYGGPLAPHYRMFINLINYGRLRIQIRSRYIEYKRRQYIYDAHDTG